VSIERKIDEKGVLLSLSVDPEDIGRVIGRRGATAQSLRTLLRALGTKNDARYNLKIVNTDGYEGGHHDEEGDDEEKVVSEKAEVVEKPVENSADEDVAETTSIAEKTRADLAEYDDLDI
jgi:predicted RNA-binding protein YlqC (UPF0109 family)